MKIEWTDEDVEAAWKRVRGACDGLTNAIMDYAVESFLARVVGQAANDVRLLRGVLDDEGMGGPDDEAMRALSRLSALAQEAESLRAKVEDAEKERDEFGVWVRSYRSEIEALKSARDVLRERALAAESELLRSRHAVENLKAEKVGWATELEQRAISAESRLAAIRERAKQTMALVAAYKNGRHFTEGISMAGLQAVARWVLEGDDANVPEIPDGSPRHSEPRCSRCGVRIDEHPEQPECGAIQEQEHDETMQRIVVPTARVTLTEEARKQAHDDGTEDMRAACWKVVQEELRLHGWGPGDGPWTRLRAAIECAKP